MKHPARSLLAFLVVLTTVASSAQVRVGVQGGFISAISWSELETVSNGVIEFDYATVTSYTFGIPIEVQLPGAVSLQVEGNYLRRGYRQDQPSGKGSPIYYNVIEVPVLAKAGYRTERIEVLGIVGPSYQYTFGGTAEYTFGSGTVIEVNFFDTPAAEGVRRHNLFAVGGVQVGVPLRKCKIVLDARYRVQLNDEDSSSDVYTFRTNAFSGTAGVVFSLFGR